MAEWFRCAPFGSVCGLVLMSFGVVGQASAQPTDRGERILAPGVLQVVLARPEEASTVDGPRPLPELLQALESARWTPKTFSATETVLARAEQAVFRRTVWQLEFGYKPLRSIRVDLPGADGQRRSALVWYLFYYVRNTGGHLQPVPAAPEDGQGGVHEVRRVNQPARFIPTFLLQGHDEAAVYREKILPEAVALIARRELPRQTVHDSVSIARTELPVAEDENSGRVWGVATWTDVNPRTDFMSVLVQGLTNAYRWEVSQDGATDYQFRTLQLHFWRPGDAYEEERDEVRVGIPYIEDAAEQQRVLEMFDVPSRVDHRWVYR